MPTGIGAAMKQVLRHIFAHKRRYAQLPLFERMRDTSLAPRERLAFYPAMAHFILSFGDLNKLVLRRDAGDDAYQSMVNQHTYEDDHHWPWYLEDLGKLGFDVEARGSDWMRLLWGDETERNRVLMYRLTSLVDRASSRERLAIIEAIEETGNVLFSAMLPIAEQLERELGVQLRYCGDFHFDRESGHTVGADHAELAAIELDADSRARMLAQVDEVFELFEAWTHELLRYALRHPSSDAPVWQARASGQ
jgi:hypothetical protein